MSKYPPESESAANSDEDDNERDGEEDEEEEAEKELAEWTELTPLEKLETMEDGPSTFFVGGYSTCKHLGDAIDNVKYKEDMVIVFPGVYTQARFSAAANQALELNEANLGGLRIYSVPFAREHSDGGNSDERTNGNAVGGEAAAVLPKYAAPSKRRVGPWFTWLTAAATATLLTQEGNGEDTHSAVQATNLLRTAANRAVVATYNAGTATTVSSPVTTTSGSSVFAPAITATTTNPVLYPVFDFPISIAYNESEKSGGGDSNGGLPHYKQAITEDEEAEKREEDEGDEGNCKNERDGDEEEDDAGSNRQAGKFAKNQTAVRRERAITLSGCCARGGLVLGALTRTTVSHCVIGSPEHQQPPLRIAVTAVSLTEALVDHCVVFGGTAYGLYAFPRAALTLQSSLVEGANVEAAKACGVRGGGGVMGIYNDNNCSSGGSVVEQLEYLHARAERLRAFLRRGGEAEGNAIENDDTGSGGSAYVDLEDGVLPRFVVPQKNPTCEVGIMCDDADMNIYDCLVNHTRLGVLLHGGCAGTQVHRLDIRSCSEVGLYIYGLGGAAEVLNSTVRACGRACLLLVGPSAKEMAQGAALTNKHDAPTGEDGDDTRHLLLAQHPYIKSNTFIGSVRVQGEVRSGAVVDNFVFLPKEEKSASATATAAQRLVSVDASAQRGFIYVGVEGDRVTGRAADRVAAA